MKKTLILLVLATTLIGTSFSHLASSPKSGYINGHKYVDLGLSVKWATCNIGASSPSDFGGYYAWGETGTKSIYTFQNGVTYGKKMENIKADPRYDAARANWGGTWRLPSAWELNELFSKCKLQWMTIGVHEGCRVTGPNGNSIFLPAAGERMTIPMGEDEAGHYWTYTQDNADDDGVFYAVMLSFDDEGWNVVSKKRYYGLSIRPVSD